MRPENANSAAEMPVALALSRDTLERLRAFVALLEKWQRVHNLVGAETLGEVWERHIADSAQLVELAPDARRWLDLGSGAGFPGLVVAVLLRDRAGVQVDLIESNQKKCAFLREAIRVTGAPAAVHAARIESVVKQWPAPVDVLTARALAPLATLCGYAEAFIARGATAFFHKGRGFERELADARHLWDIDLIQHESRGEGIIVEIRRLTRREKGHA